MAAPINIGTESKEPENKKAITIPGNTACEIASPIIAILRRMRKQPSKPQETAAKQPVNMIQKSLIIIFFVFVRDVYVMRILFREI